MQPLDLKAWQRVDALLDAMYDLAPEEWMPYLDAHCPDPVLREHVEQMLQDEHAESDFLEDPTGHRFAVMLQVMETEEEGRDALSPGQQVGPYRIQERLGRGGMGQVYKATRDDGTFRQEVAIKVIRRGMDTDEILQRFRAERQILASLSHPYIARLIDGGTTEDDRPYLVMEYIQGTRITTYCNTHKLPIADRLRLFLEVCEALQYAHRNLIVHRDLKPSNILVDTQGHAKLLDFGIAKLLNPQQTESSYTVPETREEMRIMTLEYAAPEQIRGEVITTATDVYALGALLYELLTGQRPFAGRTAHRAELERIICEEDPERPSLRIREEAAAERGTPFDRLRRRLEGDLDTMVLKALRREQDQRYASVEAFMQDLRRYLEGLPIDARPATVSYRVRKFVQRHRFGVATASALLGMLLLVTVVALRFAFITQAQSERLAVEVAKTEQVRDFLVDLFQVSDPSQARGRTITARELLEQGATKVETELSGQPEVQADLLGVIGAVYRQLGLHDDASPLLERALAMHRSALGEQHPIVARNLYDLARLREEQGRYADSERLYQQALVQQRALLPSDHPDLATTLNDYGVLLGILNRYDEAEPIWRESLEIRRDRYPEHHRDVVESLSNMATVLHERGKYEEAEQVYRETTAALTELEGPYAPILQTMMSNLGSLLFEMGAYDKAEAVFRDVLSKRLDLYGPDAPRVARTMSWLGRVLDRQGQYAEAEELLRRASVVHERQYGASHPYVGRNLSMIATNLRHQNRFDEAERHIDRALVIFAEAFPDGQHAFVADARFERGHLYLARGDYAAAEPHLVAGMLYFEARNQVAKSQPMRAVLVDLYTAWGKADEATRYRTTATPTTAATIN